ncbi:MAG: hypothetical protein MR270_07780, partial [Erysipelotrichaceae bacterium]|nr:hypothetical protein [Erysipelotrichaceae bacterium]
IASSYLTHIPNDENKVVTTDLFLPKAINNKNIEISWTSSNEEIMNHDGIIVASYADREKVSLYATIRINETIITKSFTFMVSAHSNEINFYRLVNEISPLVIYKVYSDNKDEAYYYLPLVDENSAYDYRKNYNTPSIVENESEKYVWNAHREIELVSLTYSEIIAENNEKPYNYLSLDESENNAIYLNKDTLNTYGEINVTGTFITGEVYSSVIKVILSVGTNTSILEPAFAHVNQQLVDVDILYNMLDTRINKGMANESANFKLPASFNDEFTLTYGVGSSGVITNISSLNDDDTYTIEIDPTKFSSSESSVAIEATVTYSSISQTKTFYFKVPAILTVEEFGNITNFNSIKYQVYQQLPANEKTGNSGFEISGNNIINHTPSYILLRDVIGDESYISEGYSDGNYQTLLGVNHQGCKDLFLATPEKSSVSS